MGNFSWIIIVIVIIQAIAGAVAKASEKRKAQMKKDAASQPRTDNTLVSRAIKAATEQKANQKSDLERLRAARIERLRSRTKPKQASVSAAPVAPAPVASEVPAAPIPVAPKKKVDSRPSAKAQRAERARQKEIARSTRAAKAPRDYSGIERGAKSRPKAAAPSSAKSTSSTSAGSAIKSPSAGAVPSQPVGISSAAMKSMLSDPESFKKAFILSELIAPPVSMRPPTDGAAS